MQAFPFVRMRRLRQNPQVRKMFDAPLPGPEKFLWPVFVVPGEKKRVPIDAMPGQDRLSADELLRDLEGVAKMGVGGILVFGVPGDGGKDSAGTGACRQDGVVQKTCREVKKNFPGLIVATDVCLCAYTDHGHCGSLDPRGDVDNDKTLDMLMKTAVSHAESEADWVAPSAMMDGQVQAIRRALDSRGFTNTVLMSYSSKFASAMYGPFREAENSAPGKGDRKGYQASYGSLSQALRESRLDEEEGADLLMVKPALFYLDIIARLRERTLLPLAAYNVSGEYSMLHASARQGWGDLKAMVRESTAALARAGTDIFISYWAKNYDEYFGGVV